MNSYQKSDKLKNVFYDIRGPVLTEAKRLEEEGHRILKLNIGNPAPFNFKAPDEIIQDVIYNLPEAEGYSDSKGIFSARKAIMHYSQQKRIRGVELEDIYLGNGVSELIVLATQAILNDGDEVLIPAPDYPLWTGAVTLSGGIARHYICDEQSDWTPDLQHMRSLITERTKAIVVINPNNPTGAVYPEEVLKGILQIAREHGLIVLCDEIYDKILYDGATHTALASLTEDVLCLTFNGLSKNYRLAGFRAGWMILSGPKQQAKDLIEGLNMLSSMRLCANVPAQHAIQTALGGYQSINDLVCPGGRFYDQMDIAHQKINDIPGLSAVRPKGALYLFARMDQSKFSIHDDERMVLDLLRQEKILLVHGRAFHWPEPDHFRIVCLPQKEILVEAIDRMARFFNHYRQ
ncbi:pyridoxal phosphate-dependent aminotransferase [Gynuella sp.]|uniref:pyridoxal phosphate-dependent aminotransferase n=1 Tax=Gynuella sp. TaxID=2969146 RepID=UPI003D1260BE